MRLNNAEYFGVGVERIGSHNHSQRPHSRWDAVQRCSLRGAGAALFAGIAYFGVNYTEQLTKPQGTTDSVNLEVFTGYDVLHPDHTDSVVYDANEERSISTSDVVLITGAMLVGVVAGDLLGDVAYVRMRR